MQNKFFSRAVKGVLTIVLFFLFSLTLSAQSGKTHFVINNPENPSETQMYYDAFKDFNFNSYRFLDKRRTIKFLNSNVTVELYSAQELMDLYQKPIHPLTLMDNKPKTDIAFMMYAGKVQVVTLKK